MVVEKVVVVEKLVPCWKPPTTAEAEGLLRPEDWIIDESAPLPFDTHMRVLTTIMYMNAQMDRCRAATTPSSP